MFVISEYMLVFITCKDKFAFRYFFFLNQGQILQKFVLTLEKELKKIKIFKNKEYLNLDLHVDKL